MTKCGYVDDLILCWKGINLPERHTEFNGVGSQKLVSAAAVAAASAKLWGSPLSRAAAAADSARAQAPVSSLLPAACCSEVESSKCVANVTELHSLRSVQRKVHDNDLVVSKADKECVANVTELHSLRSVQRKVHDNDLVVSKADKGSSGQKLALKAIARWCCGVGIGSIPEIHSPMYTKPAILMISSSCQPKDVHCWTKASPKALHSDRSCAFRIHRDPAILTKSSLHLVGGLPTAHLPTKGQHTQRAGAGRGRARDGRSWKNTSHICWPSCWSFFFDAINCIIEGDDKEHGYSGFDELNRKTYNQIQQTVKMNPGFEGYCTLVLWSWDMENS
ncbi:hypothetical protein MSG28_003754 [Choristoneura fumiferana]|uniref:Uncharacterized protein n=1 Tax=Choristoneura fumiferana TaxID=7141 RepID=A0ACC0KHA5_CHOFU|nr:hypothetical protein MSG28_003754 [Choristoneura fumiferana]